MQVSAISQDQWVKVLKAVVYSFVSAAIAAFIATGYDFSKKTAIAVLVAGINGALVAVKQLFTPAE